MRVPGALGRDRADRPGPGSGGYLRYALSEPELAARLVPRAGRHAATCRSTDDGNGNLFAWWGDARAPATPC